MQKSIKIDLIYYSVPKDFEFEFNLCASCQMRLLTEIAGEYDAFIRALARGVSRSRIILISAQLNRDLVSKVSDAIGYPVSDINASEFGIKNSTSEVIPNGAVPLVTATGLFGGFILERGPQSLIFVTAEREIRHEIMAKLVQPYIADLSKTDIITDIKRNTVPDSVPTDYENTVSAEIPEETEMAESSQAEESTDNAIKEIPEEPDIVDLETQTAAETAEPEPENTFSDDVIIYSNDMPDNAYNDIDNNADDFILDYDGKDTSDNVNVDDNNDIVPEKKKKPLNLPVLILSIILVLLILFIVYMLVVEPLMNGTALADNFNNIFNALFS